MFKRSVKVVTFNDSQSNKNSEQIVCEKPLEVIFNQKSIFLTQTIPSQEKELALGYLFTNGYINSFDDIIECTVNPTQVLVKSKNQETSEPFNLAPELNLVSTDIFGLSSLFQEKAILFKDTAITHSAAVASKAGILEITQDISRLNAIDKLAGLVLENRWISSHPVVMTSGKICSCLLKKCLRIGCRIVISRLGPTDRAVDLAAQHGVAIIGFARGKRFTVYTEWNRIRKS